jgi:hypothetical protein
MAEIHWYYAKGQEQFGPVGPAELKQLADTGDLLPQDPVWREGMPGWAPAARVAGLFQNRDSDSHVVERQTTPTEAGPAVEPPQTEAATGTTQRSRRQNSPARALIRLQIGVWSCCLGVVLAAAGFFSVSLLKEEAAQRTDATLMFGALALAAYIVARAAEKLLELVLIYFDARRRDD